MLLRTNPFPSVCGRVCDHKCQSKCRRGMLDEPVAIKFLKRFITDNAPRPKVEAVPVTRKEKIAVVGAGPAGLTFARDMALRGYGVTVFEELPEPGGMLRYGIPAYRLPRKTLAKEIEDISALGVEIKCNTSVGKTISFETLNNQFDYIYMAPGAHKSHEDGRGGRRPERRLRRSRIPARLQHRRSCLDEGQGRQIAGKQGGGHRRRKLRDRRGALRGPAGVGCDDPLPAPARRTCRLPRRKSWRPSMKGSRSSTLLHR